MDIKVIVLQMIQLFLVIALGYLLLKIKILDVDFNKRLTTLLLSVTTPALIVSSVLSTNIEKQISEIVFHVRSACWGHCNFEEAADWRQASYCEY